MGGAITIRQVTSMDKKLEVRDRMKKRYAFKNYPDEFSYRCKCIIVFQNLDGVDVMLFGLYVYEHDESNPAPNTRTVYVSYLDSVYYMRPRSMRTFIYHEILISYLDYVRKRGFSTAHIWACPPLKGDDYILYAKPEDQKTPKDDRLRQWYIDMLAECQKRGIVGKLTNMYDLYFADPKNDATIVPYMEGDYFPAEVENIIKDIEEGKPGSKKAQQHQKKQKNKSKQKKKSGRSGTRSSGLDEEALKASGLFQDGKDQKSLEEGGRDYVMVKLGDTIQPMKESFIVAYLTWKGAKPEDLVVPKEIEEYRQKHGIEADQEELTPGAAASAEVESSAKKDEEVTKEDSEKVATDDPKADSSKDESKESSEAKTEESKSEPKPMEVEEPKPSESTPGNSEDKESKAGAQMDVEKPAKTDETAETPVAMDTSDAKDSTEAKNEKTEKGDIKLETEPTEAADNSEKADSASAEKDSEEKAPVKAEENSEKKDDAAGAKEENEPKVAEDTMKVDDVKKEEAAAKPDAEEAKDDAKESSSDPKNGGESEAKPTATESSDEPKGPSGAESDDKKDPPTVAPSASTTDKPFQKPNDGGAATAEEAKTDTEKAEAEKRQTALSAEQMQERMGKFAAMAKKRGIDGEPKPDSAESKEGSKDKDGKDKKPEKESKAFTIKDSNGRTVKVIDDDDEELDCEFLNNRQAFLNLCQGNHYQFDQLRRAKHSSMMVLWHLHNRDAPKFVQQCTTCSREILSGNRYHCPTCADFDQCIDCVKNPGIPRHPHPLKPIPVANGQQSELTEAQRKERQRSIQLHMTLLQHAATCTSTKCPSANCTKMKGLLKHGAQCTIKAMGGCNVCKRIWALLQIHARQCKLSSCRVPNCMAIRERVRQLKKQQQAMDDRRRQEMNRAYRR